MKINAHLMRPGHIIEHNGRQWVVLKTQIVQPGKGGAFITIEMRDVRTGTKSNDRWRTADTVEKCNVEEKACTFLFGDADHLTFMDQENFEQFAMPGDILGESVAFLQDGMVVDVDFIEGMPVSISLHEKVVMTVVEADPVVKGQTASSSYKPAKLACGLKILVPPFIAVDEKIVVNTTDCTYVERAK